jgi:hypothetical protein
VIGSLGATTTDPAGESVDHLIHGTTKVLTFSVGHDRVVPVHREDRFHLPESSLDLEDHLGGRDARIISCKLPELLLGTRSYGIGNVAMASGDLDSHMGLRWR